MEENCWGVQSQPKAWAEEVEEAEQQNGGSLPHVNEDAFPSLSTAATKPAPKGKKKNTEKLSLQAFLTGGAAGGGARTGARAPADDSSLLMNLPKGSSGKRDDDREGGGGLGGAFKDYGGQRDGEFWPKDRSSCSRMKRSAYGQYIHRLSVYPTGLDACYMSVAMLPSWLLRTRT
jgi:hypothetical protein